MGEEKDNINIDGLRNQEKVCGVVLIGSEKQSLIGCFIHANNPFSMQVGRFRTS
jgi:hypothetical protein